MSTNISDLISQIENLKGNPELQEQLAAVLKNLTLQSKPTEPPTNGYQNREESNWNRTETSNNTQHQPQQQQQQQYQQQQPANYHNLNSYSNSNSNGYQREDNNWHQPTSNVKPYQNQEPIRNTTETRVNSYQTSGNNWNSFESSSKVNSYQNQDYHETKPETSTNAYQPQKDSWNQPISNSTSKQYDNWDIVKKAPSDNLQEPNRQAPGEDYSSYTRDFSANPGASLHKTEERDFTRGANISARQEPDWDFLGGRSSSTSKETNNDFFKPQNSPPPPENTWGVVTKSNNITSTSNGWGVPDQASRAPEPSSSSFEAPPTKSNVTPIPNWNNNVVDTTPVCADPFEARFSNTPAPNSVAWGQDGGEPKEKRQSYFTKSNEEGGDTASAAFPYDIVEVKLADQQADVNSPLYSVHSFDELGLKKEVLSGVYAMNYNKPSKIQERALPLLLGDPPRNLIGQSQSGTGKTAAFVISMLSRIDYSIDGVQAICLAPTRELARQIMIVAKQMSKFTQATLEFAIRDDTPGRIVNSNIVIGTPGTVIRFIQSRRMEPRNIKMFILDEADTMLDMQGMGEQCIAVKKYMPAECQKVLFSATFPDSVREFAHAFAPGADEISLKQQELSIDAIKQFYMDCNSNEDRDYMLIDLYGLMTIGQSIIFVNTRAAADRIARYMTDEGHKVIALHGLQDLRERDQMIDDFRSGKAKVMVTTNVVARGIDISQVNLVINYDMPFDIDGHPDAETYLHRIGRTGRFGRSGVAINFVSNRYAYNAMLAMEEHFGHPIAKLEMTDYEATERILKKALK